MILYVILIFCYLVGILIYIADRLETIKVTYPDFDVYSSHREMTTKDAWLGLIWPILFIWLVAKISIVVINEIVSFLCLLVRYRYNNTKIYNKIGKWGV